MIRRYLEKLPEWIYSLKMFKRAAWESVEDVFEAGVFFNEVLFGCVEREREDGREQVMGWHWRWRCNTSLLDILFF